MISGNIFMKKVLRLMGIIFSVFLCLTLVSCSKDSTSGEEVEVELSAVEIYEKVNPSVACIFSLDVDGNLSSGSAFFIDTNGTLVTNYHVIEKALAITVSMYDNEKDSNGNWYKVTSVLRMNKDLDIAILKTNKTNSVPVKLDTREVVVGEQVYAIGYPVSFTLGYEESTFSSGIISKKSFEIGNNRYIQSDVNITNGNSGGVLINRFGNVIGITSAGLRFNDIDYMNLSIPVENISLLQTDLYLPVDEIPFFYFTYKYNFMVDGRGYEEQTYSYWQYEKLPISPEKDGYTFVGWKNYETGRINDFYGKVTRNRRYDAVFEANQYEISLNVNGGNALENNTFTITYGTKDTLPIPSKRGYNFLGWYNSIYDGANQYTSADGILLENWTSCVNLTLYAKWAEGIYEVNLRKNIAAAGDIVVSYTAKYGDSVSINAFTNPGYTWLGWYKTDSSKLVSKNRYYEFTMPDENLNYDARWFAGTISKNIEEGIISYEYSGTSTIKLIAETNNEGNIYKWAGWYSGSQLLTDNTTLVVANIKQSCTAYEARWALYERMNGAIYFGDYPQTQVTDSTLINTLNTRAGNLPTGSNNYSWIDYEYYIESNVESYMWYQDISYGGEKYRGVYFTSYRPYYTITSSSTSNTYQDENGYYTANIYWFKYEPIKWNVLKEENGKGLIIADLVLDSQDYYWGDSMDSHFHNGETGYSNNYKLSHIRQWLNDTFYNTVFTNSQKTIILTTTVNNSAASTGYEANQYACDDTEDEIFLLSSSEAEMYYEDSTSRQAQGSDYAKCQGLDVYGDNSSWWLRSPNYNDTYFTRFVHNVGNINFAYVYDTCYGVRPALWIIL